MGASNDSRASGRINRFKAGIMVNQRSSFDLARSIMSKKSNDSNKHLPPWKDDAIMRIEENQNDHVDIFAALELIHNKLNKRRQN